MSWTIERRGRVAVVTMTTNPVNAQNRAFFARLHEAFRPAFTARQIATGTIIPQAGQQRQRDPTALAQLTQVELAALLVSDRIGRQGAADGIW